MTATHSRARFGPITLWRPAVAALVLACGASGAVAGPASSAREWAAAAVRDLGLQSELPRRIDDPEPVNIKIPKELVWLAVAGGVGVLLFYASGLLPFLGGGSSADWQTTGADADPKASRPAADALAAAEALARAGRFAEAMHMTLLGGVAAIRDHFGEEIADSLTSREILRKGRLSDAARGSLREIVARVERSHFGLYPASGSDYAACREAFGGLLQALRQRQERPA